MSYIGEIGGTKTLFVKDKPFMVLAGETHNSASASLEHMEHVWKEVENLNLNTLLLPVFWELIEKKEGEFDFSIVTGLVNQARKRDMHLVFLWFGLWKNSASTYVPEWFKKSDYDYVESVIGEKKNIVSPFCSRAVKKDALAFSKLMAHIKYIDQNENTVIFVQVENEIGVLGLDRDYSEIANEKFYSEVPKEISEIYNKNGTWEDIFGDDAGEPFMSYYYAKAIEEIAIAGKKEYDIPYYTNAWIEQYPWRKGSYPVGGPVAKMHKIWKKVAPTLFCLSPDIYVNYVADVMEEYAENNPLFIPEIRQDVSTATYCLYAFGMYNAIGYSPFAIEELGPNAVKVEMPPPELVGADFVTIIGDTDGSHKCLSDVYGLLEDIKPIYFKFRNTNKLKAFIKENLNQAGKRLEFSKIDILVKYKANRKGIPVAGGIIIELEENKFLMFGYMCEFEFLTKTSDNSSINILKLEEGSLFEGEWIASRRLNGDEHYSHLKFNEDLKPIYLELIVKK